MNDIEDKVIEWAKERGIYSDSTKEKQFMKLIEEVGELSNALLVEDFEASADGIGDCLVVLTNLAYMIGTDLRWCYSVAWSEIKNREGEMVNGAFIKEGS